MTLILDDTCRVTQGNVDVPMQSFLQSDRWVLNNRIMRLLAIVFFSRDHITFQKPAISYIIKLGK